MNKQYYTEPIEKDTSFHLEYLNGIECFLQQEKAHAQIVRSHFINPQQYRQNPEHYREKLKETLGFPLTLPPHTPRLCHKTMIAQEDDVCIYRIQLEFWGCLKFYGLYFEQRQEAQHRPFFIAQHGGDGTPELCSGFHKESANYNHMVRRLTERGANVFVPQLLLWKTLWYGTPYERLHIDGKLRQLGGSITALELYLLRGSIDYFIEKESINKDKIGIAGLSYGGMYALHLAAIDTRVKVCYSCSWVNDGFQFSWADWSYHNAQRKFSTVEIAAVVAPRALVIAMGDRDELFPAENTLRVCEEIRPYYDAFHCAERFLPVIFEGNHELDKQDIEIDFMFDQLK